MISDSKIRQSVMKLHWKKVPQEARDKAKELGCKVTGFEIVKTGEVFTIFSDGKTPVLGAVKHVYSQITGIRVGRKRRLKGLGRL